MFRFIKKMFVAAIGFIGLHVNALQCVSMFNK